MKQIYLVMISILFGLSAFAADESGKFGDNISYKLSDDGTFTLTGNGEMKEAYSPVDLPWANSMKKIKKIIIEEGITNLCQYAFYGSENATEVQFPSSLTNINKHTFEGCKSLTSIKFPDNIELIDESAFANCDGLTSIKFPKNLKTIGVSAFSSEKETKIETLDLSNTSIENIGGLAFAYNKNLKTVILPNTLKGFYILDFTGNPSYGDMTFLDCNKIASVTCKATTPPLTDEYAFPFGGTKISELVIPKGSTQAYKKAGWDENHFEKIIEKDFNKPDGINQITNEKVKEIDVYTLTGYKCLTKANKEELNNLPKGVYIVNGKKFIVE